MGDPKKAKKKYRKPLMIWNEERIARDKELISEYGLKNKKEIWKAESKLTSIHNQAKRIIADTSPQSAKESEQLISKLSKLNLLQKSAKPEDILSIALNNILDRRLQTIVLRNNLAKTTKQARQFITHNHISINGQVISTPSYPVKLSEETFVSYNARSSLANEEHAERPKDEVLELKKKQEIIDENKEKKKPKTENKEEKENKEVKPKESEKETKKDEKENKEITKDEKQEKEIEEAVSEERKTHKEK